MGLELPSKQNCGRICIRCVNLSPPAMMMWIAGTVDYLFVRQSGPFAGLGVSLVFLLFLFFRFVFSLLFFSFFFTFSFVWCLHRKVEHWWIVLNEYVPSKGMWVELNSTPQPSVKKEWKMKIKTASSGENSFSIGCLQPTDVSSRVPFWNYVFIPDIKIL